MLFGFIILDVQYFSVWWKLILFLFQETDSGGVVNDELPNCWECPKCNHAGKTGKVSITFLPNN